MPGPKLVELHPQLFIRGHTLGVGKAALCDVLEALNVRLVVNVALRDDPGMHGACARRNIDYIHAPLRDSQSQDPPGLIVRDLVAIVVRRLRAGDAVMCNCDSGWNRSALLAIPALAEYTGRPVVELVEEARQKRPKVLKNPVFARFVEGGMANG